MGARDDVGHSDTHDGTCGDMYEDIEHGDTHDRTCGVMYDDM